MKKVVTIGGGTGHSQVLKALKDVFDIEITGICPSTDSGGSTGVLKREYDGNGYVGDLTKCISALCNNDILRKALSYKYENGPLDNHSVKNILFHALEKVGGVEESLKAMWEVCGLGKHRVIPVTNEKAELCAALSIGNTIFGEANIDTISKNPLWNPSVHSISDIYLKPNVKASDIAVDAIKESDYIIVCPGDLYTSIIPILLPGGVKQAIEESNAKIILILNIMTKKGETDNYTGLAFVDKIEKHLGKKVNHILYNNSPIPTHILLKYSIEQKVEFGLLDGTLDSRVIPAPLVMITESEQVLSNPKTMEDVFRKLIQ
ncbi:MAG: gluconeogenesis factor YvcK family protein [bacterium]